MQNKYMLKTEKKIAAFDARRQFGHILQEVTGKGDHYVVERHGHAVAAVVPIHLYNQWRDEREAFFDRLEQLAERVNVEEKEAMKLALEAQKSVRSKHRKQP